MNSFYFQIYSTSYEIGHITKYCKVIYIDIYVYLLIWYNILQKILSCFFIIYKYKQKTTKIWIKYIFKKVCSGGLSVKQLI